MRVTVKTWVLPLLLALGCGHSSTRGTPGPWVPMGDRFWTDEPDCEVLRESEHWSKAHLKEGVFSLESTYENGDGVIAASTGACRSAPRLADASFAVALGDTCIVGVDNGEYGGELAIFEAGRKVFLEEMRVGPGPRRLVRASGQLLLLAAEYGSWGFRRLVRERAGQWRLEPFFGFPGQMSRYGRDAQGRLLLAGFDGEIDALCIGGARLYRVYEDGSIERFR
jgi:hypothetical protein